MLKLKKLIHGMMCSSWSTGNRKVKDVRCKPHNGLGVRYKVVDKAERRAFRHGNKSSRGLIIGGFFIIATIRNGISK